MSKSLKQILLEHPSRPVHAGPTKAAVDILYHRYFKRSKELKGNAEEICRQIVEKCWNGTFYSTSLGHFSYFWVRDFGAVSKSLVKLGYEENVRKTMQWALRHYIEHDTVTLCIMPNGQIFDAPEESIDALPWLLHSLTVCDYTLSPQEKLFLNKELKYFIDTFLDPDTGMLYPRTFAELRDGALYDRSAYAVTLVERLVWCTEELGLGPFPYTPEKYQIELLQNYWNGEYYSADISNKAFSAECALMPFVLHADNDARRLSKTLDYIAARRILTKPYPIRYTHTPKAFRYRWWAKTIMRNYAGTTIWTWHGTYYLRLLARNSRPELADAQKDFKAMIERYKTFPELLNPDGSLYKSIAYKSDDGMLWAAIYLAINQ